MNDSLYSFEDSTIVEGISTDLIHADFQSHIYDISCQICLGIAYPTPVSCGNCHKMFCRNCIEMWKKKSSRCPNDHEFIETPLNSLAKNLLNLVKLKCSNRQCHKEMIYGDYLKHIKKECDYAKCKCSGCLMVNFKHIIMMHVNICDAFLTKCPFCSKEIRIKDLNSHTKICDFRKIECEYCEKICIFQEYSNHQDICEFKEIECKYCRQKMKRKDEFFHEKEICFKEIMTTIRKVGDNLNDFKEECEMLKKQNIHHKKSLENQITALNFTKNTLEVENANLININESFKNKLSVAEKNLSDYKKEIEELKEHIKFLKRNQSNSNNSNYSCNNIASSANDMFSMFFNK